MKNDHKSAMKAFPTSVFTLRNLLIATVAIVMLIVGTALFCVLGADRIELPQRSYIRQSERLSSEQVKAFCETRDGYLWIGTESGLNRYDGVNYMQFLANNDTLSLLNSDVSIIRESRSMPGYLLVSTFNGSCIYCPDGKFVPVQVGLCYIEDLDDGTILVYSSNRVTTYYFDPVLRHCTKLHDLSFTERIDNLHSVGNDFWVIDSEGNASLYDGQFSLLYHYTIPGYSQFSFFYEGQLWCYSDVGYRILDMQRGQLIQTDKTRFVDANCHSEHVVRQYFSHGLLAVKTANNPNVHLLDLDQLTARKEPFEQLHDTEFGHIYRDSRGNIWAGSRGYGIQTLFARHKLFAANDTLCSFFNRKDITCLSSLPDGRLCVVTGRTHIFLCTQHNEVSQLDLGTVEGTNVYHMTGTRSGHLVLVSLQRVLDCIVQGNSLKLVDIYPINGSAYAISEDSQGDLWLGTENGVSRFDVATHSFIPILQGLHRVNVIRQLSDGRLIFGTLTDGITIYDKRNASSVHYAMPPIKEGLFSCRDLTQDRQGNVWIASVGMGIYRLDLSTGQFTNYQSFTMNPDVSCILADPYSDAVWMGTLGGLSKFEPSTGQFHTFYEQDGVHGNEFFEKCAAYAYDGTLLFGGKKGLTCFDPRQIVPETGGRFCLSSVIVDHTLLPPGQNSVAPQGLSDSASLFLPYDHSALQLNFATLNYSLNAQPVVFYSLDGKDTKDDWEYAPHKTVSLQRLSPGRHRLVARALDTRGETIGSCHVFLYVDHPWWSKPWLKWFAWPLLFVLLLLLLLRTQRDTYLRRRRIRQSLREKVALKHVSDMNMRFFSNVSHEFRTPLTLIKGATDLLRGQLTKEGIQPLDEASDHSFRIIQTNVNRMMRLVNQILDFNKLEHDMLPLRVQYQPVGVVTSQLKDMFSSGFQTKNIQFEVHCSNEENSFWLDSDKYEKVTVNLLNNAMKFTPSGGKVSLRTGFITRDEAEALFPLTNKDLSDSWLLTEVVDTGIGIPEGQRESVFERYYQTEQGAMQNNGTGIGLCFSRGLVQLHHGYIRAFAGEDGVGSRFAFILPLDDVYSDDEKVQCAVPSEGPASVSSSAETPVPDVNSGSLPVLMVVDDDTEVLDYLRMVLNPEFRIVTATSATDAMSNLPATRPELIISDVMMLGLDGYKFCTLLKSDASYCHIPVILLTAKAALEDRIEGLNAGADAYVTKPFEPAYLRALVHSLLANRLKVQKMLSSSTSLGSEAVAATTLQQSDSLFMERLYAFMESHLQDAELDLTTLLETIGMSRTKFFYKIKELTGLTPNAFFKTFKLNRAAEMILAGNDKITYIAEVTGFCSTSHFASNFKKQFGVLPSEYKSTLH